MHHFCKPTRLNKNGINHSFFVFSQLEAGLLTVWCIRTKEGVGSYLIRQEFRSHINHHASLWPIQVPIWFNCRFQGDVFRMWLACQKNQHTQLECNRIALHWQNKFLVFFTFLIFLRPPPCALNSLPITLGIDQPKHDKQTIKWKFFRFLFLTVSSIVFHFMFDG